MRKKIIATIQKIRYLTRPDYHHEVWYTVEGSDKVRKFKLPHSTPSFKKSYYRLDEIWHWWRTIEHALRSLGVGDKAKIRYDRYNSRFILKVEIDYLGDGRFYLYNYNYMESA